MAINLCYTSLICGRLQFIIVHLLKMMPKNPYLPTKKQKKNIQIQQSCSPNMGVARTKSSLHWSLNIWHLMPTYMLTFGCVGKSRVVAEWRLTGNTDAMMVLNADFKSINGILSVLFHLVCQSRVGPYTDGTYVSAWWTCSNVVGMLGLNVGFDKQLKCIS